MNQMPRVWVRRHPIASFFLLAIAMCFATLFPASFLLPRGAVYGQILGFYLSIVGVYSPVLAGIIVTQMAHPGRGHRPLAQRLKVFIPVWFIATGICIANLRLTAPPGVPLAGLIVLSFPAALLPAWVLSSASAGSEGVRRMLASLIKPTGNLGYYLIALLTFPVIHVVGAGLTNIWNGSAWFPPQGAGADLFPTLVITFCSVLFFFGGLNEESGWRGFAQQRLQGRHSPLATALILWFCMVIWHIPNDLLQYQHGGYLEVRIGLYICITVVFVWIYNRTSGSIWAVAIFHASMNSMNPLMGMFPITTAGNILLVGFAVTVIVADRMWRRLPGDHPAVYQNGEPVAYDASAANHIARK